MAAGLSPEVVRAIEQLASAGRSTAQIAGLLGLSERVVRKWRRIRGVAAKKATFVPGGAFPGAEDCKTCGHAIRFVLIDGRHVAVEPDVILATTFQPGAANERLVFIRRRHVDFCVKYQIAAGLIRIDEPSRPPR